MLYVWLWIKGYLQLWELHQMNYLRRDKVFQKIYVLEKMSLLHSGLESIIFADKDYTEELDLIHPSFLP